MILDFERHISKESGGIIWGEIVWYRLSPGDVEGVSSTQSHLELDITTGIA